MKIEVEIPDYVAESAVRSIMENFPEASDGCGLICLNWRYSSPRFEDWRFVFNDTETDKTYILTKPELMKAFPLLFTDKWPKGCTPPPLGKEEQTWSNWTCQCDATDFDAFAQLACLGEVIYG